MREIVAGFIILGMMLSVIGGLLLMGAVLSQMPTLVCCALAALLAGLGMIQARYMVKESRRRLRLWRAQKRVSALAASLTPHLMGSYTPYLLEAVQQLGEARDKSAVPALIHVLENTVEMQQPGWQEVAESLVLCLSRIGDARALPLLHRLAGIRGIGILPAIRDAIETIEPQSSLLRPGNLETSSASFLLRPTQPAGEVSADLLLRPIE